jgi:hypothetical protein
MNDTNPRSGSEQGSDPDGVRIVAGDPAARRRTVVLQLVALLLVGGCIGYAIMPPSSSAPGTPPKPNRPLTPPSAQDEAASGAPGSKSADATAQAPASAPAAAASTRSLTPRRLASKKPSQDPPEPEEEPLFHVAPGDKPREITAGEYIQALHDAGIYEGIGAFNPPGTSPPLEGLAVPPDYELPDGYVRHFQSTDDGQSIDPILMYSPDYEFFDADGNPVPIPEDRVVPPEAAPPGFPIRPVVIPPKREPGDTGR